MTPIFVACGLAALVCSTYTFILPAWDAMQAKKQLPAGSRAALTRAATTRTKRGSLATQKRNASVA